MQSANAQIQVALERLRFPDLRALDSINKREKHFDLSNLNSAMDSTYIVLDLPVSEGKGLGKNIESNARIIGHL